MKHHESWYKLQLHRINQLMRRERFTMNDQQMLALTFDKERHNLDARTLIGGLSGLCSMIGELSKAEKGKKGRPIEITVEATEQGSFLIWLQLSVYVGSLFAPLMGEGLSFSSLLNTLKGWFELQCFLKGERATQIITNHNGTVNVYNGDACIVVSQRDFELYRQNEAVASACHAFGQSLQKDETVYGFRLGTPKESLFEANLENVEALAQPNGYMELQERETQQIKADIYVDAPSLSGSLLWRVVYQGRLVRVKFTDETFLEQVKNSELSFANKDKLVVDLTIHSRREAGKDYWEDYAFEATKVYL